MDECSSQLRLAANNAIAVDMAHNAEYMRGVVDETEYVIYLRAMWHVKQWIRKMGGLQFIYNIWCGIWWRTAFASFFVWWYVHIAINPSDFFFHGFYLQREWTVFQWVFSRCAMENPEYEHYIDKW